MKRIAAANASMVSMSKISDDDNVYMYSKYLLSQGPAFAAP